MDTLNNKRVLCIRADNMGDVLMSSPAIRALSESFDCKITLLCSNKGASVAALLPAVEEVIAFDLPWVQLEENDNPAGISALVGKLKVRAFDACIIFTVYSQNPMPAIMLAYMAGIPLRLAYCRENPYRLLSHWIPDPEPYEMIRHQVERDLDLVAHLGASLQDKRIKLSLSNQGEFKQSIAAKGIDLEKPYLILHPGVSEARRAYSFDNWVFLGKLLAERLDMQLLVTGLADEAVLAQEMALAIGGHVLSLAGKLSLNEFALLIEQACAVVSVNTGTAHLASAFGTPIVVLYAMTNPQHTPWMVPCRVLPYNIPEQCRSKNKIVEHVQRVYHTGLNEPDAETVFEAVANLLTVVK